MKPTKNKIFCVACKRPKMLFESKSKADNFMKYNAGEILEENGKAPVRSYYCTLCGGWHLTSNPSTVSGERFDKYDKDMVEQIDREIRSKEKCIENRDQLSIVHARINDELVRFNTYLRLFDFDKMEDILEICNRAIDELSELGCTQTKILQVKSRIRATRNKMEWYKIYYHDEEMQNSILEVNNPTEDQLKKIQIVKDAQKMRIIKSVFANKDDLINCTDNQLVLDIISKCIKYIGKLSKGEGAKNTKRYLKEEINQIVHERKLRGYNTEELSDNDSTVNNEETDNVEESPILPYSSEDKANILSVISKLELIKSKYEEEDFSACQDEIDICEYILDGMRTDDNTSMLRNQLANWKRLLGEERHGNDNTTLS